MKEKRRKIKEIKTEKNKVHRCYSERVRAKQFFLCIQVKFSPVNVSGLFNF